MKKWILWIATPLLAQCLAMAEFWRCANNIVGVESLARVFSIWRFC